MTDSAPEPQPFSGRDFLVLARELAQRSDEASLRTAVSRGYYGVFHIALGVLQHHDTEFHAMRVSESHKLTWDRLAALPFRQAKTAARTARSLLNKRKAADYRLEASNWREQMDTATAEIERAIRALVELMPNPLSRRSD